MDRDVLLSASCFELSQVHAGSIPSVTFLDDGMR